MSILEKEFTQYYLYFLEGGKSCPKLQWARGGLSDSSLLIMQLLLS